MEFSGQAVLFPRYNNHAMSRKRKAIWLGSILLALAGGIGGYYWYWQSNAIDRKVCELVYEAAGYPDSRTEKFLKKWNMDFLLHEKPKPREYDVIEKELLAIGHAATPGLVSLLDDENREVRLEAVNFLSWIGDGRAVEPLICVLQKDKDESVRLKAAEALGKLDDKRAVEPLIKAMERMRVDGYNHRRGPESTDLSHLVEVLGEFDDKRAVEPLVKILLEEKGDSYARSAAAITLGKLRDKRAFMALVRAMQTDKDSYSYEDSPPCVRANAAYALGLLGDKRAVDPLVHELMNNYKNCPFLQYAIKSLGRLGEKKAVDPLIHILCTYSPELHCIYKIQSECAQALGNLGDPRAIPALEAAMKKDSKSDVRESCQEAIAKLKSASTQPGP
ncbi:MAG: HEAT repeat domain-containing protein [Planctomycetes bacterium]|nr:HEAT repeat domain-containing protein [Planctomycetota bacterium]